MRFRLVSFFLLFATASTLAGALQDSGLPPMGAPKEMKEVAFMVGSWKADFQMKMGPQSPWQSSPSTLVVEKILSGSALRSIFASNFMGMDFDGIATLTYNRDTGKWQNTWVDNMGAFQTYSEGEFKDGKLVMEGDSTQQGQPVKLRETTQVVNASEYHWHMDMSMDGGKNWFTTLKATYKKQ